MASRSFTGVPDEAALASIMVESILYGIYFVLFTRTLAVLFRRTIMRTVMYRVMITTAIVMWIIATAHISISGVRIVQTFAQEEQELDGGSTLTISRSAVVNGLIGVGLNFAQVLVGDGFLLYRMAVVWGRDWRIYVFPLILLSASTVTAGGVIYQLNLATPAAVVVGKRWIVSFITMTLSTNIFCTSLIAVKVWKINSLSLRYVGHSLTPVMLVVVESGSIYSCTLIALLVCYLNGSWARFLVLDWLSPIVGCVFSMVIVRLGMGLCRQEASTFQLQEPETSSMLWQTPRRPSSDVHKLTVEEATAIRGGPASDITVASSRGQSPFPTAVDSLVTEPRPVWRG